MAHQDEFAGAWQGKHNRMAMTGREFQIFIKPVGAECNLKCHYCYYLGKKNLYHNPGIMSYDVLENYIIGHFRACDDKVVNFSWHGGEPLLAGMDFFKNALALQRMYKPEGKTVINSIQTNGTLLNDEWCRFLSEEKFLVGLSIDGTEDIHNIYRKNPEGFGSFNRVMNGFRLLKKRGIIPEILCVVNAENVKEPLKIYRFFRKMGVKYVSFLPLVERRPDQPAGVSSKSVPAAAFGIFLSKIFDEWVSNGIGEIKIQIFEEAARTAFNQDHTLCIFKKTCGGVPVVERNGDFYNCDHYVDRGHLVGNVGSSSVSDLLDDHRQQKFGLKKLNTLPSCCINCSVRDMCNGECPKNRFISTPEGEPGLNYLCEGYKLFFTHCKPFVDAISQMWKSC